MTPPPPRTPAQVLDIVIGVLLTVVVGMIGTIFLATVAQLANLSSECVGITPVGLRCSPEFLRAMGILGTGIVVFSWFLAAGFLIVRFLQRKRVFFLPLIAFAVMIAGFYLVIALVGTNYVPAT